MYRDKYLNYYSNNHIPEKLDPRGGISTIEVVENLINDVNNLVEKYKECISKEQINNINQTQNLEKIKILQNTINSFKGGTSLLNNSIGKDKLKKEVWEELRLVAQNTLLEIPNVITPGINGNGEFYVDIPLNWNINFKIENGNLILEY